MSIIFRILEVMMQKTPNSLNFLEGIDGRLQHDIGDGKELLEIRGDLVIMKGDFLYRDNEVDIPVYYNHFMKKSEILQAGVTKEGDKYNCFIRKSLVGNGHGIYSYITDSEVDVKHFESLLIKLFEKAH